MEDEKQYTNFDEARMAAETMDLNNPNVEQQEQNSGTLDGLPMSPEQQDQPTEPQAQPTLSPEQPTTSQEQPIGQQPMTEDPNTDYGQQFSAMQSQMAQMSEQNQKLTKLVEELSNQNKEQIIDENMEMPIIDIGGMAFDDEDTIKTKQQAYANDMANYIKQGIMKDIDPYITQAKQGMAEREKNEALNVLKGVPELNDLDNYMPQIDKILQNNTLLNNSNAPIEDRIISAYAIAKGVEMMNQAPKSDPTADELMKYYNSNPEFQNMLEQERLKQVKPNQGIPQMSSSSGAVNAALHMQNKPKSFDEASELVRKMFGA